MIIKRCEWLSKSAQEAVLFVGNENYECAVFLQPCSAKVDDSLVEPLLAINVKGIAKIDGNFQVAIDRQGASFAHDVVAEVIDSKARLVSVDSIIIELDDPLPGDINSGDVIQFSCGRLDVIA